MDLKQLEYFVTVINEGTISSAARKLNLLNRKSVLNSFSADLVRLN